MNKLYDNSVSTTREVTKGIVENMVGIHGDCASLVTVLGGMVPPSEYEGQVSCWLPWNVGEDATHR